MAACDQMHNNSLYVGDLHPQVTENDLHYTFSRAGPLLSLHLCRDRFTGKSRCYAYVNFWLPCHAYTARECLNHTLLRGKPMRIMWYVKNPIARNYGIGNLFVKNLHQSITSARLESTFSKYGTILSCKVVERNGISRGFGYVQFDSEDSAMQALSALNDFVLEGKKLYVSRFRSKIERKGARLSNEYSNANYSLVSNNSNLIVKNLDPSVDDKKLAELFSGYGKLIFAKVVGEYGVSTVGFVCFSCPDNAKKALNSLTVCCSFSIGTDFEGRILQVEMAQVYKPVQQLSVQPHYTSINQQQCYNFPGLCGNVSAFPMQAANLNEYFEMLNITNGNGNEKEFRKDTGALKTFRVRLSGYIPKHLFLQDKKPCSKLQGKLDNGDVKELRDSSDTTKPHCTESSYILENFPDFQ
ncbi:hypothetical protein ACS0TY_036075 [Phlomoides rotata]